MGYATVSTDHLQGIRYPGIDQPRSYVPTDIPLTYQPETMGDIDRWVRNDASRLMFIYGERDPYSAEPFQLGPGTRESFWFQVPEGNHSSRISMLPRIDQQTATRAIKVWAHVNEKSGDTGLVPPSSADALGGNEPMMRGHGFRPMSRQ
jgi:hypothetical protein